MAQGAGSTTAGNNAFRDKEKPRAVRSGNITAARAVADAIRTSLGPRGMDKMIQTGKGETIITNDGNTMLRDMAVMHPAAKMLVDLANAQDIEAGDGTTSVVVIAGSLLGAAERLLGKGLHPTTISESFQRASAFAVKTLEGISTPIDLADRATLLKAASTSLSSKIVAQEPKLAPMAVDAVLRSINPANASNVDLRNIRILKKPGGVIDDSELLDGLVLSQQVVKSAGGPTRIEKAKIALIQFQLSPPKPDMENQIIVNDYRQMDKILKEERTYLLNLCKKIKKSKCNVLLIQKSILRDAVNDLSLHFLHKLGILVVKDIERDEVEFICKSTGCKPIADIDYFAEDKLGTADLVEEVSSLGARYTRVSGVKLPVDKSSKEHQQQSSSASTTSKDGSKDASASKDGSSSSPAAPTPASSSTAPRTVSIIARGANPLILDEAERSLHDAMCVIRCLVKRRALLPGGGAPEMAVSTALAREATTAPYPDSICWKAYAEALEIVPVTLAENAGLNSIKVVTEMRARHVKGESTVGVSIKRGGVGVMGGGSEVGGGGEGVMQPLLVSTSAIELASETVKMILRIDDIALSR